MLTKSDVANLVVLYTAGVLTHLTILWIDKLGYPFLLFWPMLK